MSLFTMEDVNHVMVSNFSDARVYVEKIIDSADTAKPATKNKARLMLAKSNNSQKLAFAMSSWILAHPDEGLKVI